MLRRSRAAASGEVCGITSSGCASSSMDDPPSFLGPCSLLSVEIDVAWRGEVRAVYEDRVERTDALVGYLAPGAPREHHRMAARSVVRRREHGLVASEQPRHRAWVELRPVGEH